MQRSLAHAGRSTARVCILAVALLWTSNSAARAQQQREEAEESGGGREAYEVMRLADPETKMLPAGIRERELRFATRAEGAGLEKTDASQSIEWVPRGPRNIGGRTMAIGIDVADERVVLAGGTTGGMWRSSDGGASWRRTTSLSVLPSTTCLAQDTRVGRTRTWYYGTGQLLGNTGGYSFGQYHGQRRWGAYFGNGIFKSIDNGVTWSMLPATSSPVIGSLVQPFNFVNRIVTDASRDDEDIVYAAVPGAVQRSSDGGASWTAVLQAAPDSTFPEGASWSDVCITSTGVLYAAIVSDYQWKRPVGDTVAPERSTTGGIFRSTDGIHWTAITPPGWRPTFFRCLLAVAPSNEDVVYVLCDGLRSAGDRYDPPSRTLWKYTYLSGDGSGTGGRYDARPVPAGEAWVLAVNPDNEHDVFVGGVSLYRSGDGFAGGGRQIQTPHVDHWAIVFAPSAPSRFLLGCDGGIFRGDSAGPTAIAWTDLNPGFTTAQFYTVALDHATPDDQTVIGGMQDNGTGFTSSATPSGQWVPVYVNDGATCAIADGRSSYYVSWQRGRVYRKLLDDQGGERDYTRIDPVGSTELLWINPYMLDPNDQRRMYAGGGTFLWRNDDVTAIRMGGDFATTTGWTKLVTTAMTALDPTTPAPIISAITATRVPAGRVYYGTNDGRLFRLDAATEDSSLPQPLSMNKGLPHGAFVNAIAVDGRDGDHALVAFANYNVQSIFRTTDAGTTWTSVGGSLEEHPDGTGSGPSVRSVAIVHVGDGIVYLAGTSTGLYSTTLLDGPSTVWTLEGPTMIGNAIVNMIDARESDGMVAVATCGSGVFTGRYRPTAAVLGSESTIRAAQCTPNPFSGVTEIEFDLARDAAVTLVVFDMTGTAIATIVDCELRRGRHKMAWDASDTPSGMYCCRLTSGSETILQPLIVQR